MNRFTPRGSVLASLFAFVSLAGFHLRAAETAPRLQGGIGSKETFRLSGNTKPQLALAQDQGEASLSQPLPRMAIHFAMTSQQQSDLEQLLRQQQTPGSALYHKFLTPEEYGARFGPSVGDIAQVTAWLTGQGFTDVQVARSRMYVRFAGVVAQAQSAFGASIHRYTLNGESHFANSSDPMLPKALDGMVRSIGGLNSFRLKPHALHQRRPLFTSNISGSHFLTPGDLAVLYDMQPLYQSGVDGTGVKIAVAGQSDIQLSDIQAFRAAAGLPPRDPTVIVTGSDPGLQTSSGDERESDLDVEWTGAIARNATIVFVTSSDVGDSITYAIDNNVAPVLSLSYGACEASYGAAESRTQAALYQQANAQGMTVVAAAGDDGAADCDSSYPAHRGLAVDLPASLPSVTGVGGTTLSEGTGTYWSSSNNANGGSVLSYIPEIVWNDTSTANGLAASGGGASLYNAKPSWQNGTGVPNDGARDVPDVSLPASVDHDGYLMCSGGDCVNGFRDTDSTLDVVGGTSGGSPVFAGIVALLVQTMGAQGNINPNLYALAQTSTDVFHDVTAGNNVVACRAGSTNCPSSGSMGFGAGAGYDQATGLGSVDTYHLWSEWRGATATVVTPTGPALSFVPMTPCRVVDTRNATGAFGGPELNAATTREFDLPSGTCGIPATAAAYALNVTVVPSVALDYLTLFPSGQARPLVSTLNSDGRIKANAAIVPAGTNGGVSVFVTNPTHVVIDVSGYFLPASSSSGLQFYPVAPCRVADTRNANGSLGGPFLPGGTSRDFPVVASGCGVPSTAQAYSLNFTVVPRQPLVYFAAWQTGQVQPLASILNSPAATVTANGAMVPAGSNGAITTYSSNDTDLVIDINGYFAPASSGGSYLYTVSPCRVLDTRNPAGSAPFSGTIPVDAAGSGCQLPATAQAYVLNATVVPAGPLQWLTLWASGQAPPLVSTLNADPSTITSNLAVVPQTGGLINAYATQPTYLILDAFGYFAP